jgi:type I restriction enzyme S subunit
MADNGTLKPGWTKVKFGEVVRLCKDRSSDPEAEGIERYVGLEHLEPEDLRIRRWGLVAEGTTFTSRFKPGQVLFGKRRAYQRKVAVADFEGVCSGDIYVFESADPKQLLPELLPFICQTEQFFNYAVGTSMGSLSPRTNWKHLKDFEIDLPPIDEQTRILSLLKLSEERIESLALSEESADSLISSIREDFFDRENTKYLDELLTTIQAGKSLVGSDISPKDQEYAVLKVSAVGAERFKPEEAKVLNDQNSFISEYSVQENDILITRANTSDLVGMSCLVDKDYPNLMLSDKTLRLVPQEGVSKELLIESLWTAFVRQQLRAVATGTGAAMKNISQKKLLKLQIPWAELETKSESFLTRIQEVKDAKNAINKRWRAAHHHHQVLVNRLMLGGLNE